MMMTNVNYATLYFKYPVPTPINGEPTNKKIKRLKHELRANVSSVDIDLGGGDHGYLGVYLLDVEYAWIILAPTPFVALVWPGALVIYLDVTVVVYIPKKRITKKCGSTESVKISKRHCCVTRKTLLSLSISNPY